MPQKALSVPLFCQNLTTVNLCYQAVQINFLTNCKRSKILQQDLSSKRRSKNTSNPFFKNSTGYQSTQESQPCCNPLWSTELQAPTNYLTRESSTKSQPCAIILCLKLLTVYYPSRQLRSMLDTKTFRIPLTKTKTFGEQAFSFTGPKQWNSLPYDVRHSPSLLSFKKALKTSLFKSAYE